MSLSCFRQDSILRLLLLLCDLKTCLYSRQILHPKYIKIPSIMAASASEGMLLMDDSIAELVRTGYVSAEEAGRYVSNPARLA